MTGVYGDETHGLGAMHFDRWGPTITPEISAFLDREMDWALRKASFMASADADFTEDDAATFVRNLMKPRYEDAQKMALGQWVGR